MRTQVLVAGNRIFHPLALFDPHPAGTAGMIGTSPVECLGLS